MIATTQIGPAWIGRTIAALMLRLFTRHGCRNPAHNHSQDWAVAASQCPDYRQRITRENRDPAEPWLTH